MALIKFDFYSELSEAKSIVFYAAHEHEYVSAFFIRYGHWAFFIYWHASKAVEDNAAGICCFYQSVERDAYLRLADVAPRHPIKKFVVAGIDGQHLIGCALCVVAGDLGWACSTRYQLADALRSG